MEGDGNQLADNKVSCRETLPTNRGYYQSTMMASWPLILTTGLSVLTVFLQRKILSSASMLVFSAADVIDATLKVYLMPRLLLSSTFALVSNKYANEEYADAGSILKQGSLIALISALCLIVVLQFTTPFLELIGVAEEITPLVSLYNQIYAAGVFPYMMNMNCQDFVISTRKERFLILWYFLTGLASCLACQFWITESLSNETITTRYAIVNASQQWLGLFLYLSYFLGDKFFKPFQVFKYVKQQKNEIGRILKLSLPLFCLGSVIAIVNLVVKSFMSQISNSTLAIDQAAGQIANFAGIVEEGIREAAGVIVAQAGAKSLLEAAKFGNAGLLMASMPSILLLILFSAIPLQLAGFFIAKPEENEQLIRISFLLYALVSFSNALQEMYLNNLEAILDTLIPPIVSIVSTVVCYLPATYLLDVTWSQGLIGVYLASLISTGISVVFLVDRWRFKTNVRPCCRRKDCLRDLHHISILTSDPMHTRLLEEDPQYSSGSQRSSFAESFR
jgi:Na+-driven multidrug efflux pump